MDVVNLEKNRFETVKVEDLITSERLLGLEDVVSVYEDGFLRRPAGAFIISGVTAGG